MKNFAVTTVANANYACYLVKSKKSVENMTYKTTYEAAFFGTSRPHQSLVEVVPTRRHRSPSPGGRGREWGSGGVERRERPHVWHHLRAPLQGCVKCVIVVR